MLISSLTVGYPTPLGQIVTKKIRTIYIDIANYSMLIT